MNNKITVIELLNAIEQRYTSHVMQYYALNDELEKHDGKLLTGEPLIIAHKSMICMDDIFAEDIQPIGQFVAERFQEGLKILELHEDLKQKNQPQFKLYTGSRPVIEPLMYESIDGIQIQTLKQAFHDSKKRYNEYNTDLAKLAHVNVAGETLQHLLRTFFEMDEFFCQELYPILSFIANHYKESSQMAKEHYEFKLANMKLEQDRLKNEEKTIVTTLH